MNELEHVVEQQLNLYQLLDLDSRHVSDSQIKKRFRSLALKYHPDKNRENPEVVHKFHLLSLATHILTSETLKGQYDKWLESQDDYERKELIERLNRKEAQTRATETQNAALDLSTFQKYGELLRKRKHFKMPYDWSRRGGHQIPVRFYDSSTLRIELQNSAQFAFLDRMVLQSTLESLWKAPISTVYYSSRNGRHDETVVAYVVFTSALESRRIYKSYKAGENVPQFIVQITPRIPVKYYKHRKETSLPARIEQLVENDPIQFE